MNRTLVLLFALGACGHGGPATFDAPQNQNPDAAIDASIDAPLPPDAMMSSVVQCPTPVTAPVDGTCDATAGTGTAVVLRGDVLGDGTVYKDGGVIYDGDTIQYVGCDYASQPQFATATHVDCAGAVISPGLINPHDHTSFDDRWPLAGTVAGGTRYQHRNEWGKALSTPGNKYGTGKSSNGMRWNELRQALNGTTSIAGSTMANGMARNLDSPDAKDTSEGLLGLVYEVFMLGDSGNVSPPPASCGWSYDMSEYGVYLARGMVTHTSEGINAYAHDEFLCESTSFGGGRDFTEKNVAHIHAIGLDAKDYYLMAHDHTKMIWSPRSNLSLYGNTGEPQVLVRLGGTVALGTDWTYSGSATESRELQCAADFNHAQLGDFFTAEDLWKMATINAAIATETDDKLGSLTVGKLADLAIFAAQPGQLHAAVFGTTTDKVALVIRGGLPLSGEADVVSALGPACDPITVCGKSFQVCASREYAGQTYAALAAAVNPTTDPADQNNAYPAVFCDTTPPPLEPTCVPSRPNEYNGATAGDMDGDGVPDATDDCPTIFNPIRPMDGAAQADVDGDGLGDACDPTPLGDDIDADGVPNMVDNCPESANPDQADLDADQKGDVCDFCPMDANPDHICLPKPSTIGLVRGATVAVGAAVSIPGVVVTGIDSNGFTVQDPTVTNGMNAGVYAYVGSKPTLTIGDVVTVAGTKNDYFNRLELDGAVIQARASGTPLAPIALTVLASQDEAYESVLVTVNDVTATTPTYDCSVDNASCMDTLLWLVNSADNMPLIVYNQMFVGGATVWSNAITAAGQTPTVTGVMNYRYNRRRIMPRSAADIVP
jgi:hypothetical protein